MISIATEAETTTMVFRLLILPIFVSTESSLQEGSKRKQKQ